jgi:hypothetical protein
MGSCCERYSDCGLGSGHSRCNQIEAKWSRLHCLKPPILPRPIDSAAESCCLYWSYSGFGWLGDRGLDSRLCSSAEAVAGVWRLLMGCFDGCGCGSRIQPVNCG